MLVNYELGRNIYEKDLVHFLCNEPFLRGPFNNTLHFFLNYLRSPSLKVL
jgi:hypothetical protein